MSTYSVRRLTGWQRGDEWSTPSKVVARVLGGTGCRELLGGLTLFARCAHALSSTWLLGIIL